MWGTGLKTGKNVKRNVCINHKFRLWCARNYVTFEIQNEEMIAGERGFFAAVITTFLLIINWQ